METGIYIRVDGENIDIGNPNLDIVVLYEYISNMIPITRMRTIMSLLGRREEFEEFICK